VRRLVPSYTGYTRTFSEEFRKNLADESANAIRQDATGVAFVKRRPDTSPYIFLEPGSLKARDSLGQKLRKSACGHGILNFLSPVCNSPPSDCAAVPFSVKFPGGVY